MNRAFSKPPSAAITSLRHGNDFLVLALATSFLSLSACSPGELVTSTSAPQPSECLAEAAPPSAIRRISSDQFRNTLRDLFDETLGEELTSASVFPETVITEGFASDAYANTVNESESNRISENAQTLASLVSARMTEVMPCVTDPSSADQVDACIDDFIRSFGLRAYRRPLTPSEAVLARSLYNIGREQSPRHGFESVIDFFLQSPALLYQTEYGSSPVAGRTDLYHLSDYELATRLSFFLWNTTPDSALLAAAEAGELASLEGLEAQARRLAQDPRVFDTLVPFHRDLTRTYRLDEVGVGDPGFTEVMRDAMREETQRFLHAVDARGELSFAGIFGTDLFPITPALAPLYGVDSPGSEPVTVSLPHRRGILATASAMASISAEDGKNPTIMRAVYILEEILCQGLPPFPADLDTSIIAAEATLDTARERLANTTTNPVCNACHSTMNPPGFALEQYDALGRFRLEENGATIDASGAMSALGGSGQFADSQEFLQLVAQSPTARACYVEHWVHAALGRPTTDSEECIVEDLATHWRESDDDLRELLIQITLTDNFRYREIKEAE